MISFLTHFKTAEVGMRAARFLLNYMKMFLCHQMQHCANDILAKLSSSLHLLFSIENIQFPDVKAPLCKSSFESLIFFHILRYKLSIFLPDNPHNTFNIKALTKR